MAIQQMSMGLLQALHTPQAFQPIYQFRLLVTGICNMGFLAFFLSLLYAGQKRQVLLDFLAYERKKQRVYWQIIVAQDCERGLVWVVGYC